MKSSVLPPSPPQVLEPVQCKGGTLQVHFVPGIDSHALFITPALGERLIAVHPNGHTCKALANRMALGIGRKVLEQAEYIVDCGGPIISGSALVEYTR